MTDIIIVGAGKASKLHIQAYNKFETSINKYIIDKNETIEECIKKNNLNIDNIIVDIVTPKEAFDSVISECEKLKLYNIIIEKPFVVNDLYFYNHPKLNIFMVQNYIYSEVTNYIKKYINDSKQDVISVFTDFSKNRIEDSFNGRGRLNEVVQNFEIEVPHQVYLVNYILGKPSELRYMKQCDMQKDDKNLKNHGYGFYVMKCGKTQITHMSDLCSTVLRKQINVQLNNGVNIVGEFPLYDANMKCLKGGEVKIYKNLKLIKNIEFGNDDMMFKCLKTYYDSIVENKNTKKYKSRIQHFSKTMKAFEQFEDNMQVIRPVEKIAI